MRRKHFGSIGLLFLAALLLLPLYGGAASGAAPKTTIHIVKVNGVVGVPLEEHVGSVFDRLGNGGDNVLILKMDTPGGLVDSMSAIISKMAEANYPVVVWVAPAGARAASAGAFIVQAAHVAAMAPETNIGAAHPVTGSGKDIGDEEMARKVTNDLTAKIRAFAQERGRNVKAAESMVTESVSLTAREALEQGVIDLIASDEEELLKQLDGRAVRIKGAARTLSLANYEVRRTDMTLRLRALELFSRPDIAYLALIVGVFLILLEVKAPGGFVMGVAGALLLLAASYGLRVLPVNLAGVALLVAGVIVVVVDLLVGGMGILAAVGIGAMLFGGLILYRAPGGELLHLSAGFFVGVTLVVGVLFLFILRLIYRAMRRKPASGAEGMVGMKVRVADGTSRMAMVRGEYWKILPLDPRVNLELGDEAEVVKVDSLTLYVKTAADEHAHTEGNENERGNEIGGNE